MREEKLFNTVKFLARFFQRFQNRVVSVLFRLYVVKSRLGEIVLKRKTFNRHWRKDGCS